MRTNKKDWIFINNAALLLYAYNPINETQAKVSGTGKIWNDKVKVNDGIIVESKNNKNVRLIVNEINFTGNTFDALVSIDDYID